MPKAKATSVIDHLSIPWFLDAKNPSNIKFREVAKQLAAETATGRPLRRPKSVATDSPAAVEAKSDKPPKAKDLKGLPSNASGQIIRVLISDFGHKAGSKAETKSNGFRDGMTVSEYMAGDLGIPGKWHKSHISHCVGKGFIKLEDA